MTNFIVSYDLNGPHPSHKEMDEHLASLGVIRGRVLETVWYVAYSGTLRSLYDSMRSILGSEDRLLVAEADEAAWHNLLIADDPLLAAWNENRG